MGHVFLSHNSADKAQVIRLARALERFGVRVWLDAWELRAGSLWEPHLAAALEGSVAVLACVGNHGKGPWHDREIDRARTQGIRLEAVLLPGWTKERGFLGLDELMAHDWTSGDEGALCTLAEPLAKLAPLFDPSSALPRSSGPFRNGNPYPGLESFDAQHARWFFGREVETAELVESLRQHRWVWLIGNSGSGKSSLARAGVMTWWSRSESAPGYSTALRVLDKPGPALAGAIGRLAESAGAKLSLSELREIEQDPSLAETCLIKAFGGTDTKPRLLIVVDGFEGMFVAGGSVREGSESWLAAMTRLVANDGLDVRILAVLRSDFLARVLETRSLSQCLAAGLRVALPGLADEALRDVIEYPAILAGGQVEEAALDRLVLAVRGNPDGLALLQDTLATAWGQSRDGVIRYAALPGSDGPPESVLVEGLRRRIREFESAFADSGPGNVLERAFQHLCEIDDSGTPRGRRVTFSEVESDAGLRDLLARMVERRFLVTGADSLGGQGWEIVHEAVIRSWPAWLDWTARNRTLLRQRAITERDAVRWDAEKRPNDLLLRGVALAAAEAIREFEISALADTFIATSRRYRSRSLRRARFVAIGVLIVFVIGSIGTSLGFLRARRRAEDLARVVTFQDERLRKVDAEALGLDLRNKIIAEAHAAWGRADVAEEDVEVRKLRLDDLLAGTNSTSVGLQILEKHVLGPALASIRHEFSDRNSLQSQLLQSIATTYRELGLLSEARQPQAEALALRMEDLGEEDGETLESRNESGELHFALGEFADAQSDFESVSQIRSKVLGKDHPETLQATNNLALTLMAKGDLANARRLAEGVLPAMRRVLGDEHEYTLKAMGGLGGILLEFADVRGARRLLDEAESGCRRVFGDLDERTIEALNNVAVACSAQGDLMGAKARLLRVVEAFRRTRGDEHPNTLLALSSLGTVQIELGEVTEGLATLTTAFEVQVRVRGFVHLTTSVILANLAVGFSSAGQATAARGFLEVALSNMETTLGAEHHTTLKIMQNLGVVLRDQGEVARSKVILDRVLEVRVRLFGRDHPDTITTELNLANTDFDLGDRPLAKQRIEDALERVRASLGADHPLALQAMQNLAEMIEVEGDHHAAREMLERVYLERQRALGDTHPATESARKSLIVSLRGEVASSRRQRGKDDPDTLAAQFALAEALLADEEFGEALEIYLTLLGRYRRLYGEEHAATLDVMEGLAKTQQALGHRTFPRKLFERVLAARRRLLGTENPKTLRAIQGLASALETEGDVAAEETTLGEGIELSTKLLGKDHPDTLRLRNRLGEVYYLRADFSRSKGLFESVLEDRSQALGRDHVETLVTRHDLAEVLAELKEVDAAVELHSSVLAARKQLLGDDHAHTLLSMNALGLAYYRNKEHVMAIEYITNAMDGRRRNFGDDDISTLISMNSLALACEAQGDIDRARSLYESSLAGLSKKLGEAHRDTKRVRDNLASLKRK